MLSGMSIFVLVVCEYFGWYAVSRLAFAFCALAVTMGKHGERDGEAERGKSSIGPSEELVRVQVISFHADVRRPASHMNMAKQIIFFQLPLSFSRMQVWNRPYLFMQIFMRTMPKAKRRAYSANSSDNKIIIR